jgi:hypothetical protein
VGSGAFIRSSTALIGPTLGILARRWLHSSARCHAVSLASTSSSCSGPGWVGHARKPNGFGRESRLRTSPILSPLLGEQAGCFGGHSTLHPLRRWLGSGLPANEERAVHTRWGSAARCWSRHDAPVPRRGRSATGQAAGVPPQAAGGHPTPVQAEAGDLIRVSETGASCAGFYRHAETGAVSRGAALLLCRMVLPSFRYSIICHGWNMMGTQPKGGAAHTTRVGHV